MEANNLLISLLKPVLPCELTDYFEMTGIEEKDAVLHIHLDELNIIPMEYAALDLAANGFYQTATIKDFPLREKKVLLDIRRRRWIDREGKSYSRLLDLTAEGTRYSKGFAYFFKEAFGYLPDTGPIT